MNIHTSPSGSRWRQPRNMLLAGVATIALAGGGLWRGVAAHAAPTTDQHQTTTVTAPATTGRVGALAGRDSFADVAKVVEPSVVTIRTVGRARVSPTQFQGGDDEDLLRRFFGQGFGFGQGHPGMTPQARRERALGSGVIVTGDGYILTNYHVVEHADSIKVDLPDHRTVDAKVVGSDQPSDLALLKIDAPDIHPIAFGNSDGVQVGDVVLAVGNPLGLGETVTMGIVSAKGRSTGAGDGYEDFLQTDAPINHGNSGGALVDTRGELVGINSQIISPSDGNIGIGFAIPVNMAKNVMEQLRQNGHVSRAQLGVTVQPVTSDMAASLGLKKVDGAIVSSVADGSAAARAGIKQGDVIEDLDGQPVNDINTLRNRVAEARPGSTVNVTLWRDGSEKTVGVKLDELKSAEADQRGTASDSDDKAALGVSVAPVTPELASRLGLPSGARGVVVQDVNPDGRAADAGIQAGDVIEQVNRRPVQSVDDLRSALHAASDKPLLLLVSRQGHEVFVTVPAV